jgi:hypothetical protein
VGTRIDLTLNPHETYQAHLPNHRTRFLAMKSTTSQDMIVSTDPKELCRWLRDNSSGIYRPAACAADLIEKLQREKEELRRENEKLKKENIRLIDDLGSTAPI